MYEYMFISHLQMRSFVAGMFISLVNMVIAAVSSNVKEFCQLKKDMDAYAEKQVRWVYVF